MARRGRRGLDEDDLAVWAQVARSARPMRTDGTAQGFAAAPDPATAPAPAPAAAPAPAGQAHHPVPTAEAAPAPAAAVDVAAVLERKATERGKPSNWRTSIVDLMKLLGLDSSLQARKELAAELHYSGDTSDSASMNIWLHRQVMNKLAANGGKVPAGMTD